MYSENPPTPLAKGGLKISTSSVKLKRQKTVVRLLPLRSWVLDPESGRYPVNASGSGGSQGGGGRVIFATPSSTNAFQRLAWGNGFATELT